MHAWRTPQLEAKGCAPAKKGCPPPPHVPAHGWPAPRRFAMVALHAATLPRRIPGAALRRSAAYSPCRRRAARRARYGRPRLERIAGPGPLTGRGGDAARYLAMAWPALSLSGAAEGPHDLLLGRRGLRAGVALHRFADQAGADRMGRAHLRDRRHQDAADGEAIAGRGCTREGGAGRTARQGGARYLRRAGLLRRLLPGSGRGAHPFVREEPRRAVVAHAQPV